MRRFPRTGGSLADTAFCLLPTRSPARRCDILIIWASHVSPLNKKRSASIMRRALKPCTQTTSLRRFHRQVLLLEHAVVFISWWKTKEKNLDDIFKNKSRLCFIHWCLITFCTSYWRTFIQTIFNTSLFFFDWRIPQWDFFMLLENLVCAWSKALQGKIHIHSVWSMWMRERGMINLFCSFISRLIHPQTVSPPCSTGASPMRSCFEPPWNTPH